MTKTSQHLAEELTRKCALHICSSPYIEIGVDNMANQILQSIPLVELLEFVREAYKFEYTFTKEETVAYTNITTKLKQLGIDV